jgi:hypothetical protein
VSDHLGQISPVPAAIRSQFAIDRQHSDKKRQETWRKMTRAYRSFPISHDEREDAPNIFSTKSNTYN